MKFKLTDLELKILTNFGTINYNFMFRKNEKCLKTVSTMRNIIAKFDTNRIITTKDIGIYKMDEFLNTHDRFDSSELELKSHKVKDTTWNEKTKKQIACNRTIEYILFKDEEDELKYYTSDPALIVYPTKMFVETDEVFHFELQGKQITKLLKFSKLLGLVDIKIYTDEGHVCFQTLDKKKLDNNPSNSFKIKTTTQTNMSFYMFVKVESLKMLIGDYKVTLYKVPVIRFNHLTQPLTYWIACEPDYNFEDLDITNEKGKMLATKPTKSTKK